MREENLRLLRVKQEAQLSLGKTRYNLYSFYCNTDLQGHPRSKIFVSSKKQYATFYVSDQWQPRLYLAPFSHNTCV